MYSRLIAVLAAVLLVALPTMSPAMRGGQNAEKIAQENSQREPHMAAALEHLRMAQQELQKAAPNKGGHREKALEHTNQAISQVEEGIRYFNEHRGK
jgi:hypothetical protein